MVGEASAPADADGFGLLAAVELCQTPVANAPAKATSTALHTSQPRQIRAVCNKQNTGTGVGTEMRLQHCLSTQLPKDTIRFKHHSHSFRKAQLDSPIA